MKYDPLQHQRRSVRLVGYDYAAPGVYFVTIVTHQRETFFEQPAARRMAETCWRAIPEHARNVTLDAWVIMPNHVHGIIDINDDNHRNINDRRGVQLNAPTAIDNPSNTNDFNEKRRDPNNVFSMMSPRPRTLAVIVRTYKAAVTTACRGAQLAFGWQRGYHEHVVRGPAELSRIRAYIQDNPARWAMDQLNPAAALPQPKGES